MDPSSGSHVADVRAVEIVPPQGARRAVPDRMFRHDHVRTALTGASEDATCSVSGVTNDRSALSSRLAASALVRFESTRSGSPITTRAGPGFGNVRPFGKI